MQRQPFANIFMCSGPSGVGKNTVLNLLREKDVFQPNMFSVSSTTRSRRPGEVHCVDYCFVTKAEFELGIAQGEFLEHAQVGDFYYGTPIAPIRKALVENMTVFIDLDVQGAMIAKKALKLWEPQVPVFDVFIVPPSMEDLEVRLRARETETEFQILARLDRADREMLHVDKFTCSVVNDNLDECVKTLAEMWKRHHNRIADEAYNAA